MSFRTMHARIACVVSLAALVCILTPSHVFSDKLEGHGAVVRKVMADAHKSGLLKKVAGGEASDEEKGKLLEAYVMMWEAPNPAGDAKSWTDKTGDLMISAARMVLGEEGAAASLEKTSSCGGCHKAHKRKRVRLSVREAPHVFLTDAKAKYTIKEVMKVGHKGGLLEKVQKGEASKEEKKKLLDLYISMWESKPSKGELHSWKKLSGNLIAAAAKAVLEKEGAADALKAASNCGGCHKPHKGE